MQRATPQVGRRGMYCLSHGQALSSAYKGRRIESSARNAFNCTLHWPGLEAAGAEWVAEHAMDAFNLMAAESIAARIKSVSAGTSGRIKSSAGGRGSANHIAQDTQAHSTGSSARLWYGVYDVLASGVQGSSVCSLPCWP
jgi:hypothetical protein